MDRTCSRNLFPAKTYYKVVCTLAHRRRHHHRRRRPRRRRPYANRRRQYLRRRYGQQGHMASEFKKNYEVRKCAYAGRVVRWRTHCRLVILQCAVLMWPTLCFHHRNFTKRTERIASLRRLRTGGAIGCQACSTTVIFDAAAVV